jgi:uncharacterized membrane protein YbhN (UPF0104 family)
MRRRAEAALTFLREHPRVLAATQMLIGVAAVTAVLWAVRGSFRDAGERLGGANPALVVLACVVIAAYYLLFVVGWIWILGAWGVRISYVGALGSEMVSMLAKYIPGGIWTPAARVVAARRAGVTQTGLVTASMLVEAGLSAISGVLVFVISLAWVDEGDAYLVPLIVFGAVLAVLLHPRIFKPLANRVLGRFGYKDVPALSAATIFRLLGYYAFTWLVGGLALWVLLHSVGVDPSPSTIPFLGGVTAVGAIVAVLAVFAPSGLGVREGATATLLQAITTPGAALAVVVLNRLAITVVEILLLVLGGLVLRSRGIRLVARESES